MTTVWIKLYLHREDTEPGEFPIDNFEGRIHDLKKEIKKENPNSLQNFDTARLNVYSQETPWPIPEGTEPLPVDSSPPKDTSAGNPLIVVPPNRYYLAPQQGSKANLVLLDLQPDDINNPKNILRLHKTLERYFDHKQLTFVESGKGRYMLKVLDGSILSEQLEDSELTVTDVDGKCLKFHNASRPWRRILALHSIMAHRLARKQGWVNDEDLTAAETNAQTLANHSLDIEAQERLKLFLREQAVAEQTSSTSALTIIS